MAVNRCICKEVSFRRVRELALTGLEFDEIRRTTGCSTGCGACELYARLAAITGVCDLPVLSPHDLRARIEAAQRHPASVAARA
ncbi:MAG: (2Fe-2S)-binding protein [Phycisphaerales bacterium]